MCLNNSNIGRPLLSGTLRPFPLFFKCRNYIVPPQTTNTLDQCSYLNRKGNCPRIIGRRKARGRSLDQSGCRSEVKFESFSCIFPNNTDSSFRNRSCAGKVQASADTCRRDRRWRPRTPGFHQTDSSEQLPCRPRFELSCRKIYVRPA